MCGGFVRCCDHDAYDTNVHARTSQTHSAASSAHTSHTYNKYHKRAICFIEMFIWWLWNQILWFHAWWRPLRSQINRSIRPPPPPLPPKIFLIVFRSEYTVAFIRIRTIDISVSAYLYCVYCTHGMQHKNAIIKPKSTTFLESQTFSRNGGCRVFRAPYVECACMDHWLEKATVELSNTIVCLQLFTAHDTHKLSKVWILLQDPHTAAHTPCSVYSLCACTHARTSTEMKPDTMCY